MTKPLHDLVKGHRAYERLAYATVSWLDAVHDLNRDHDAHKARIAALSEKIDAAISQEGSR